MSDNSLALRIDAANDELRLAHTKGVVLGTVLLRALADGNGRGVVEYETKLREFISSSRRAREETRDLFDFLRDRLAYKQRVVEDVDSLIDQLTESLGIGEGGIDVDAKLRTLFPGGVERGRTDPAMPLCPVCTHRHEDRVVLTCGHSFCASCVRRAVDASNGGRFACFVCRREPSDIIRLYL